jgi:hypothetical protein
MSSTSGRARLSGVLDALDDWIPIYIFGGAIRDIALKGSSSMKSDLDLVSPVSIIDIIHIMDNYFPNIIYEFNRYGGIRFNLMSQEIDLWPAKESWAFKEGVVRYYGIHSLLDTTITNWDAVLYDWRYKEVICHETYFNDIEVGFLDINLMQNPNPVGRLYKVFKLYHTGLVEVFSGQLVWLLKQDLMECDEQMFDYISRKLKHTRNMESFSEFVNFISEVDDFYDFVPVPTLGSKKLFD